MKLFIVFILIFILVGIIIAVRRYMTIPRITLFKGSESFQVLEEGHHFRKNSINSIDFTGVTSLKLSPNVSAYIALRKDGKTTCPKIVAISNYENDHKVVPLNDLLQDKKYNSYIISSINVVRNN